jgi:hypothetical protein
VTTSRRERDERLRTIENLLEQIKLATILREPSSPIAVDAYEGLRRQVIAAVSERAAHLHQLAEFDAALRAGATPDDLAALVREWMGQASLVVVDDPSVEGAFETVGDGRGDEVVVRRPAYMDAITRRIVRGGVAERMTAASRPREGSPA